MKYHILYKPGTGEVKAYCKGKPIHEKDKLDCIKLSISEEDMDKIQSHQYYLYIENKKLKFKLK